MNTCPPRRLTMAGGILIAASGLVSLWVGSRSGAMFYDPDPGGRFGHVGIVAGLIAVGIGGVLIWLGRLRYTSPGHLAAIGLATIVVGHLGAIAGALLVGTAGVILCYIAGVWFVVLGVSGWWRSWRGS